jgi:hypothetical protein
VSKEARKIKLTFDLLYIRFARSLGHIELHAGALNGV